MSVDWLMGLQSTELHHICLNVYTSCSKIKTRKNISTKPITFGRHIFLTPDAVLCHHASIFYAWLNTDVRPLQISGLYGIYATRSGLASCYGPQTTWCAYRWSKLRLALQWKSSHSAANSLRVFALIYFRPICLSLTKLCKPRVFCVRTVNRWKSVRLGRRTFTGRLSVYWSKATHFTMLILCFN